MKIEFNETELKSFPNFKGGEGTLNAKMFFDGKNRILYGRLEPSSSIGLHCHDTSSEIIYIISGNGKVVIDGSIESLKPGDCHYCPKGHFHSLQNEDKTFCLDFFAVVPEDDVFAKMQSRRSIRKFLPQLPPKEKIEKVIEAGRWAASGRNLQSSIIVAVTNKEIISKLTKINGEISERSNDQFYGAPVILIVLSDKNWRNKTYDGSLILGNMMLMAHDLGLGSCWIHRAREEFETPEWQDWLKSLGVEGEWEGIGHLALGIPDGDIPDPIPRSGNKVFWCE
ncbi:MAG: nitroreductase family protein [Treponema sp.]|nr:nitroreductase family protein [Treponema sp.]